MFQEFSIFLEEAMRKPLPGKEAHLDMLPKEMASRILIPPDKSARLSSVLLAIYPEKDIPTLLFIKRQEYNGAHSGQISFPGGKKEEQDASMWHTALRESEEEINLDTSNIKKIGKLTDMYVERSNHIVHPYVGILPKAENLIPDTYEVQCIIKASIPFLVNQVSMKHFTLNRNKVDYNMPYYDLHGEVLWGATAMMACEFIAVIKPFFK